MPFPVGRRKTSSECDGSHASCSHHVPHHEAKTASSAQILQPSMSRLPYLSNHLMGLFTQCHLLLALNLTSSIKPNTRASPPLLTCFAIHHALTASYPAHTQGQPSRLRTLGDYPMSTYIATGSSSAASHRWVCQMPCLHCLTNSLASSLRCSSTYPWASSAKHKMKQASPLQNVLAHSAVQKQSATAYSRNAFPTASYQLTT